MRWTIREEITVGHRSFDRDQYREFEFFAAEVGIVVRHTYLRTHTSWKRRRAET